MGDNAFFLARIYAENILSQANVLRAEVVTRVTLLRESMDTHREAFGVLSRDALRTGPEADLETTERELRHAADMIAGLRAKIDAGRAPVIHLQAAE